MSIGDENKEEGELTDDDSETNTSKANVAAFEDYAEPISSPEWMFNVLICYQFLWFIIPVNKVSILFYW